MDIAALCTISCLRGLEVKAPDGGGKGESETDQETNATEWGGSLSRITVMNATGGLSACGKELPLVGITGTVR